MAGPVSEVSEVQSYDSNAGGKVPPDVSGQWINKGSSRENLPKRTTSSLSGESTSRRMNRTGSISTASAETPHRSHSRERMVPLNQLYDDNDYLEDEMDDALLQQHMSTGQGGDFEDKFKLFKKIIGKGGGEGGEGEAPEREVGPGVKTMERSDSTLLAWDVVHKFAGLEIRQSDELMARRAHANIKYYTRAQMGLAVLGMCMCVVENEVLWQNGGMHFWGTTLLKTVMSLSTIALLYVLYKYYENYVLFLAYKNVLPNPSLFSSGMVSNMAIEMFINALHVPVGLDAAFEVTMLDQKYKYNYDVLQCFVFLRFYLIVRLLRCESMRFAPSARLRGNMCRVPFSTWYVLKGWMLEYPWHVLGSVQVYFIFASAYTVRLWERTRPCTAADDECINLESEDFKSFTNALWLIFATMSTVGYGDYSAATHPGRLASVMAQFGGQALLALVINVFYKKMELDNSERKVFDFTATYNLHRSKRLAAARIIGSAWIFFHYTRKVKEARQAEAAAKKRNIAMRQSRKSFNSTTNKAPGVSGEDHVTMLPDLGETQAPQANPNVPVYNFAQRYRMMNMAGMRYNQAKKEWQKILQRESEIAEVQHDTRSTLDETMICAQITDARVKEVHKQVRMIEAKLDAVLEALGASENVRMPTPLPEEEAEAQVAPKGEQPHEVEVGGMTPREIREAREHELKLLAARKNSAKVHPTSQGAGGSGEPSPAGSGSGAGQGAGLRRPSGDTGQVARGPAGASGAGARGGHIQPQRPGGAKPEGRPAPRPDNVV